MEENIEELIKKAEQGDVEAISVLENKKTKEKNSMAYIIEGIVSEIENEKPEEVLIKLQGLEGYAIKIDDKKYNILFPIEYTKNYKEMYEIKDDNFLHHEKTLILSQNIQFLFNEKTKLLLVRSNALGKHVRIKLAGDFDSITKELEEKNTKLPVSSITLLAN